MERSRATRDAGTLLILLVVVAACRPEREPAKSVPVEVPAQLDAALAQPPAEPADASAPDAASDAPVPPIPAPVTKYSWDHVCGSSVVLLPDNGPVPAKEVEVRYRPREVRPKQGSSEPAFGTYEAWLSIPSRKLEKKLLSVGTSDPYGCCSKVEGEMLTVTCTFSGADFLEGRAFVRREGTELVMRWCMADLSTSVLMDHGEARVPFDARPRFIVPKSECMPLTEGAY